MLPRSGSRALPIRVEPYFGFRDENRLYLTVRALRSAVPDYSGSRFFRNLGVMLRQYASREVEGLAITLRIPDSGGEAIERTAITGPEGFARFEIAFDEPRDLANFTRWEEVSIAWPVENSRKSVTAHILAPGKSAAFGVISDIDDTILETGITGDFRAIARNWRRVMAQMPHQRRAVAGAPALFDRLAGPAVDPAHAYPDTHREADAPTPYERPVFYVSSSPWNLFSYLFEFKRIAGMPAGPALLRDWGFNRRTLGKASHGSHKLEAVGRIVNLYGKLRFVLVGDDSQKDLIAFCAVATKQPERIAAVIIRQVAGEELPPDAQAAQQAIIKAGVPYWRGRNFADAEPFIDRLDLVAAVPG